MSYCRWSCDSYRSDLYCYEDVSGGYTTYVASMRYDWTPPEPNPFDPSAWNWKDKSRAWAWLEAYTAFMAALDKAPRVDIGLPCGGMRFNDPDLPSFRQRIVDLIEMGYRVPDHVLPSIDAEIAEGADVGI